MHTIHEDRDGVLWFARTDGLMRYADGRFVRLTTETGFPLRNLTGLVEDQKHNFWIGSTLGISRIDRAELVKAVAGSTEPIQYALFDRSDGIAGTPQSSYSLGRPVTRASDGRLWFVTGAGVTIIDPKTLETVRPPGPVRVERVIANDTTFAAAPALRLPARSSRLQIDYTVVNLTSPLAHQLPLPPRGIRPRLDQRRHPAPGALHEPAAEAVPLRRGRQQQRGDAALGNGLGFFDRADVLSDAVVLHGDARRAGAGRAGAPGGCGCVRCGASSRCASTSGPA